MQEKDMRINQHTDDKTRSSKNTCFLVGDIDPLLGDEDAEAARIGRGLPVEELHGLCHFCRVRRGEKAES